jgi:hypothetical protein
VCEWGDVPIPFCCVFGSLVSSTTMADGSPVIVGGGVADTRSMIQVRLGSGSTTPDLAAMLWGSSSTSVGGWSSGVSHGGRRCFSFRLGGLDCYFLFFQGPIFNVGALFMF